MAKINKQNIQNIIKDFYRNDIWDDHTKLSELYKGHSSLIDWGRNFMENEVLKSTWEKNSKILTDNKSGQTISFTVHKDSPIQVKHAISILEYTGIIYLDKENIREHYALYNRYKINLGIVLSSEFRSNSTGHVDPINRYKQIVSNLDGIKPTSYGNTSKSYKDVEDISFTQSDFNKDVLQTILQKNITNLDLSKFLVERMKSINISTIGDVLKADIENLKIAKGIGKARARKIFNETYSAAIEYISG
ncbi:helix-hairpin-helix domain-containing protein [Paraclostridium sp. AKS81]|uniref:helix-hairpin-helix domain-containing protein n=1 Tax=Paraclostridium sp. AKS81 TaxID=2876117 RepID=UPI0021E05E3E|nr:helix-hairpin-helix domain-containing protein [Paraclostridium sp. AKS81]MCU9811665.1 helix-hairpin-helix domain-containing protein [Paraclostridium sp. AKS81]